jgi:DNA-directed RNA polymerase specialized sigma24 family protein
MSRLSGEFILDGPPPGPLAVAKDGLDGMKSRDRRQYIENAVRENLGDDHPDFLTRLAPDVIPECVEGDTVETAERLLEAIRVMPEKFREPLLLRHSWNLSYREMGAILGMRENAVQVRSFRARRMLLEKLGVREAKNGKRSPLGAGDGNGPEVEDPAIDGGRRP